MVVIEPDQRCYNHHCGKLLTEDDFRPAGWKDQDGNDVYINFYPYHLCAECFARFDGQKMRGRFRMVGIGHNDLLQIQHQIEQDTGRMQFHVGHPSDEGRYTESMTEWISWQGDH